MKNSSQVPLLEVTGIRCGYSSEVDVLQEVSLTVPEGSLVGLIGLNGAGKSTLMKAIFNFLPPRQGRVLFDGRPLERVAPHRMIDLGITYIPQESSLFPHLTVEENLQLVACRLRLSAAERARRLRAAIDAFPALGERLRHKAGSLSGGQQKALEFARALVVRPRLCLIDEPTVGLAPAVAEEVYGWVQRMVREFGTTVLLIDHDIPRVLDMADFVYILNLGRITAAGSGQELRTHLESRLRDWLGLGA